MNLNKTIINSLLIAIAFILRQITPPLLLGMKPDFSLVILFIIILLNQDYKTAISTSIVCGILAAASTTFPGGQIPNIIDKFVTANCVYFLGKFILNKVQNPYKIILITIIGTAISGFVFLSSAYVLAGLPGSFLTLYVGMVLPTTLVNAFAGYIIFNAIKLSFKHTRVKAFTDVMQ